MNKIEQLLKTNKKTYLYSKRITIKENFIKSIFQLAGAMITYPKGKKETFSEYNKLKNEGYTYQPKK